MWPVPSPSTPYLVAAINSSAFIDSSSFSKAGRKIQVGDCALFKLPNDSPPFVGIIRRLIVGREENLKLSVNWFYRPADVKLEKGALLEAAPNEVFYSFHKDEIPAASLLHPCKVAFLRQGVELPSGISSFVCRRVYDIENKCLWWLTDQNYINQGQEVDQLLDKTQAEMHGAVQTGGRSPKSLNAPNGTTQVKSSSDNVQNNSSISSLGKSRKREHSVHSPESVKRECLSKADETDAGQLRPEHTLKSEIAKITDKGGLVDFEGVEKLVQLMQPESAEKKIDLACRVMLVDVISVTDRFDCLGRFVQLRGLLILDEWLQEVHKGKIGDVSPKGSDKSVEEFLFALLRALDRLPVNLHALQTCNVGKSVNHLRSHKNSEIQKKARSLVDTWKKRVEAEMNIIETRSGTRRAGSWPSKSMMTEVSHMGSRRVSGSSDADAKVSTSQPSVLRSQPGKPTSGEAIAKSPESPGSTKLAAPAAAGPGSSDMPLVTIKEEKTNSSSPSANNSQSCSGDHGKAGPSCREDAPSSTSGSLSVNKISSGISHSRKSSNAVHGSSVPGGQKEGGLGKFGSVNRNFASGKGSPIRATPEKVADVSFADNMNSQRLIVRLPNTGRSLAHTASGGSLEDASNTSGKSPLMHPEKQDHHDRRGRGKVDAQQGNNVVAMNTDLCQGKEELVGSDDVKRGIAGIPCDEHGRDGETVEKLTEASKGTGSPSDVTLKPGKSYETSYSSVNALVESCAKLSEVNVSVPAGDDVGMNLLASVAAGEMSRSAVSPLGSFENKPPLPEDTCSGNDAKLRQSVEDGCQSEDNLKATSGLIMKEHVNSAEYMSSKVGSKQQVPVSYVGLDSKATSFGNEKTGECNAQLTTCVLGLPQNGNAVLVGPDVKVRDASASVDAASGCKEGDGVLQSQRRMKLSPSSSRSYHYPTLKPSSRSPSCEEDKKAGFAPEKAMENVVLSDAAAASAKVETQINDESASWSSSEKHEDEKKRVRRQSSSSNMVLQKEAVGFGPKAEEAGDKETGSRVEQTEKPNMDSDSSVLLHNSEHVKENIDKNLVPGSGGSAPSDKSPVDVQEDKSCLNHADVAEGGSSEEPSSRVKVSSIPTPVSEMTVKLDFDLNEVLPSDDGNQGEVDRCSVTGRFSSVHTPYPVPSTSALLTGNRPASITIAAAAKGFFPSENLLRGKAELGWKGSAATSAFRPAEPRKVVDVPLTASDVSVPDDRSSKHARTHLDFDLNVGVIEDVNQNNMPSKYLGSGIHARGSGGLGLDLNTCQESPDVGPMSVSFGRPTIPQLPPRSLLSGRFTNSETSPSTGFDLNSGPGVEEIGGESVSLSSNGMQFLPAVPSVRMNGMDMGNLNFSPWFSPSSTYPAMTIPPVLAGRGEPGYSMVPGAASQRMLSPATAGTSFNPEAFRGPVLSSSPAVAFPSSMPFQFPGFPFETNFAATSNTFSGVSTAYVGSSGGPLCFPSIPSQLVGPSGMASTAYRPFIMSMPGGSGSSSDGRRWGSQGGLDLNAGPGGTDIERRDETLRQGVGEEQLKVFQQMTAGGGVLKRKEPDDGWDGGDRISYKHPSWQ